VTDSRTVPPLARDVLSIFVRHPETADNLEGVVRWRLLEATVHHAVEETSAALHWLVEQRFLEEEATAAAGSIFSLNPDRRDEARRFLAATRELDPETLHREGDHGC
jgi:hypothetical protein